MSKVVPNVNSNTFCITIVGSGVSTAVPVIGHLSRQCACAAAMRDTTGPNRRNNVSLLITLPSQEKESTGVKHVLIDCGKTFRDAYFRVLASRHVRTIDALLITHDHADAMAGLDDLRDLQHMRVDDHANWIVEQYIPTYATKNTLDSLQRQFGYIWRNSLIRGPAPQSAEEHVGCMQRVASEFQQDVSKNNIGIRRSAALELFTLPDSAPTSFYVPLFGENFAMYAVPVEHGAGYISLGFIFGGGIAFQSAGATIADVVGHSCIVYLSDVSAVPECTMTFLQDLVKIDVLIVDMLYGPGKRHPTHYCMDDVIQLVECLQPGRTYTVGMYCVVEHESGNKQLRDRLEELRREGKCSDAVLSVELAFDGLDILVEL